MHILYIRITSNSFIYFTLLTTPKFEWHFRVTTAKHHPTIKPHITVFRYTQPHSSWEHLSHNIPSRNIISRKSAETLQLCTRTDIMMALRGVVPAFVCARPDYAQASTPVLEQRRGTEPIGLILGFWFDFGRVVVFWVECGGGALW